MKIGDMVRLQRGVGNHFNLKSYIAILIEKIPRDDNLEYDWLVMTDGRFISLGRQIEQSAELIDEAG
tara:strand:- start:1908 stop:2108 length:201 start_codon:yes stop_codon:yes gene_type:complete